MVELLESLSLNIFKSFLLAGPLLLPFGLTCSFFLFETVSLQAASSSAVVLVDVVLVAKEYFVSSPGTSSSC